MQVLELNREGHLSADIGSRLFCATIEQVLDIWMSKQEISTDLPTLE